MTLVDEYDRHLLGYTDELTVRPGGRVGVFVTSDQPYRASVKRVDGAGGDVIVGSTPISCPAKTQTTQPGSYARVPHHDALNCSSGVTVEVRIMPTTPAAASRQGIVTKWCQRTYAGWGLYLDNGRLVFSVGDGSGRVDDVYVPDALRASTWYHVVAGFAGVTGELYLILVSLGGDIARPSLVLREKLSVAEIGQHGASLLIGAASESCDEPAWPRATGFYNGKIEHPSVYGCGLTLSTSTSLTVDAALTTTQSVTSDLVAAWDFSRDMQGDVIIDIGRLHLNGHLVNGPMRAVTSSAWTGDEQRFLSSPSEYAAIHFHEDDLRDAGWDESFAVTLPADAESGAYVVDISSASGQDRIPFFVAPRRGSHKSIAFLVPTFTYLAYGNNHLWERQNTTGVDDLPWRVERASNAHAVDRYVAAHPELGLSLYDLHADGSGVCYASRHRPLLHLRESTRQWLTGGPRHFAADILFLQWLNTKGFACDVLTDEMLHAEGAELLRPYDVVISGSHPEYATAAMLDALHDFVEAGGNFMYLGGNGFYWVTSVDPLRPYVIEVRRGIAGTRNWTSSPGECYHSTTGEYGGLWRHRGRPPQQLVGVGFAALGYLGAAGYKRMDVSYLPEYEFVFRGVDADVVGEFGLVLDGAAGDEIDRFDLALGSPNDAVVLASSHGRHDPSWVPCIEDLQQLTSGRPEISRRLVRADMTYFRRAGGGAVFSVGSINWIASLASNDGDNEIATITENVLRHFATGDAKGAV
jgi:N,N-dimethylformamidase